MANDNNKFKKGIPDYYKDRQFHAKDTVIRKKFGKKLKLLRKEQGYSQESFADKCELHRTYIGDIERGERNVSLDNLNRIANGLKIDLSELFKDL